MASKKFSPKGTALVPKSNVNTNGGKVKINYPSPKQRRRRVRFSPSVRARVGRMPRLGDKFIRLFSLFLVCLVLFSAVTNAEYSSYEKAVGGLYEFTEDVSIMANVALQSIAAINTWSDTMTEQFYIEDGASCIVSVKIKGDFYDFLCIKENLGPFNEYKYKIIEAYDGKTSWVGKYFRNRLGWMSCPDWAWRVCKISVIQSQGE